MKLTYKQMLDAEKHLGMLIQLKPAPTARLASQIARNARLVGQALPDFYAARDALIAPLKDADGKFDEAAMPEKEHGALVAEYTELLETAVEVEVHPLRISDIEIAEERKPGFEIPGEVYFVMDWMFVDEE